MSRRIDVELTSDRGDGTWSWRAAGARQPKGVLDAGLLYEGAQTGDVVRVEADFDIDGITVIAVQPPKGARAEPPRIEVVGVDRDFSPITSSLTGRARERAERGEDDRPRRRDDRGPRSGAPGGRPGAPGGRPGGAPREGARGASPTGGRPDRPDRPDRPARPPRPEPPAPKPKAKKLRPARVHRDALLSGLSPEQQPIAEQLLRGGMPAVRAALEEHNAKAKAEGGLAVPVDTVLGIAEQLVTRARVADWLDRAEAAKATGEELALRDLRSVVSSADDVARDEATRELAAELKATLEQRTEAEQAGWLTDVERSLADGRVVRALRLSSRPPEPGTSFPAELTLRLTEAANAALTADIAPDRWATVLDAVAYSPVRRAVVPAGIPAEPGEELLAAVRKHAGRTPTIATLFGIEPPPDKAKARAERPARAAGRNANLSRAGGARNAAVPVPGRPGGAPVPPVKRIPPPPGRQIGATLPGSPPVGAPVATSRPVADPTAPLAPPSATGIGDPVESVGTPEAQPATLEPTAGAQPGGSGGGDAARTDAQAPEGETGPAATTGTPPAEGEPSGREGAARPDAPGGTPAAAEVITTDPEVAAADPEAAMAFDAAPSLIDGPAPEAAPAPAALATDEPPTTTGQVATGAAVATDAAVDLDHAASEAATEGGGAPTTISPDDVEAGPLDLPAGDAATHPGEMAAGPLVAPAVEAAPLTMTPGGAAAAPSDEPAAAAAREPRAGEDATYAAPLDSVVTDDLAPSPAAGAAPTSTSPSDVATGPLDAPAAEVGGAGTSSTGDMATAPSTAPANEAGAAPTAASSGDVATGPLGAPAGEVGGAVPAPSGDVATGPLDAPPDEVGAAPTAASSGDVATGPLSAPAGEAGAGPATNPPDDTETAHMDTSTGGTGAAPSQGGDGGVSGGSDGPSGESGVVEVPEEADVALSAPSDSALPEDAPTSDPSATAGTDTPDELDAIVSQAAEGPFEPPADPPVEGAPNSAVGSVAAQQEGSGDVEPPAG